MRARFLGFTGAITAAAIISAAGSARAQSTTGAPVLTHCIVSALDVADVPAQEPGVIVKMIAKDGQRVSKGDVLAQIDDAQAQFDRRKAVAERDSAAEKAQSDVDINYAKAAADVAYFEWQKSQEAYNKVPGSVVLVDLNRLKLTHQRALFQIEQAELEKRLAKYTVEEKASEADAANEAIQRRQIKSPLDGVISQVTPHLGEWVKPGDTVVNIIRMDRLQIETFLKAKDYPQSEVRDRPVTVTIELAHHPEPVQFSGKIVFISPQEEAGNEYRVKAEVDNRLVPGSDKDWLLHPGAIVTMRIDMN